MQHRNTNHSLGSTSNYHGWTNSFISTYPNGTNGTNIPSISIVENSLMNPCSNTYNNPQWPTNEQISIQPQEDFLPKINFEKLNQEFKVTFIPPFKLYLKDIWKDWSDRSNDKGKGWTLLTFSKYYELPGILCDRIFSVFDKDQNNYLTLKEFISGMVTLFTNTYSNWTKMIFKIYDFDRDGTISQEDVKLVLSYIPLKTTDNYNEKYLLKFEEENFFDKAEVQNEIQKTVEKLFPSGDLLDELGFVNCIENINSDIFIFWLIFLYEKRPFSDETQEYYKKIYLINNTTLSNERNNQNSTSTKFIASPSIVSKFRPSITISKSTWMQLQKINQGQSPSQKRKYLEANNSNNLTNSEQKKINEEDQEEDVNVIISDKFNIQDYNKLASNPTQNESSILNERELGKSLNNHEGYLFKISDSNKWRKYYFKWIHKDWYYYLSSKDKVHQGLHNLSGVFIKEGAPSTHDGVIWYTFSVVYPKKIRTYYTETEKCQKTWLTCIRKAIGYEDWYEIYDVKDKIGNGRFGVIRVGLHKAKNRDVAIKIINKKDMNSLDYLAVKNEIEILKIAKHPQIVQLYDIIENEAYIYIIMEHCKGGGWFEYWEKRRFKIPEPRAAQWIHRLATAIYFLHEYGIIHRNIKPENIWMTDNTDDADIRLYDFSLSKRLGPNETWTEPVGTLCYMAPEVLLEKNYTKSADIWSLGVITYLLLCGCWPFDDEDSDKEIIRQVLYDNVPYPNSIWKKWSNEANLFIDRILQKEPIQRITLVEIWEHQWIEKYTKTNMAEIRKKKYGPAFSIYASAEMTTIKPGTEIEMRNNHDKLNPNYQSEMSEKPLTERINI